MSGHTEGDIKSTMEQWMDKNKKWLVTNTRDPTKIAKAHIVATKLTADQMCSKINWGIMAPDASDDTA